MDETKLTYRPMKITDIFKFNRVNLDHFTETYNVSYYGDYLSIWPELCVICEAPDQSIVGYLIAKVEGEDKQWHGHVTALSVAPEYRRYGIARKLMNYLEEVSTYLGCNFVDLYVRPSNTAAVSFYRKLGYIIHKQVTNYYTDEDGYDMRKPILMWDKDLSSVVESKEVWKPSS
ncbi:N-acetyltransferase 5, putative [Cryptosporidium muris RN66]|uniref:N-acetyltransferase 5, putative n=1 Tax=Cryptosporidium muris (strain RN66) TaxID=441375 RepID=B6AI29_CRYMR|nr:N-acetyltransferase 5, putative [Cryptosporidium muris RN66]EEA07870.1 N-acetyltransferase 5, putative [Cryptosporidium muris RN66]|eukprot:XP_002142219.1 N-acetyltransferase 5 [Cryptosporidium muris RN66]